MIDKSMSKSLIKKIVLAAGLSNRYGKKNKLSQYINNKPVINHLIDKLLSIYDPSELLIVIGYEHKTIINLINNPKIELFIIMIIKKVLVLLYLLELKN